jgi:citrate lyase subunit beta/citryl-CoA lyase
VRSLLFAPGNRADLIAKLPRSRPDAVAIDLEDGTPPAEKEAARGIAAAGACELTRQDPSLRVFVRANAPSSPYFDGDLEALLAAGLAHLAVPKVGSVEEVRRVEHMLEDRENALGRPEVEVLLGIETVAGVLRATDILCASRRTCGVYFGGDDFATDLGARRTRTGEEVLYARSHVVMAARLAGIPAIDQAVFDFRDDELFLEDARRGRDLGYAGKLCVHPRQVELAHLAFTPSPEEVEYSRRLLAAWQAAVAAGRATLEFEGQMVDGPLVRRAEAILASATAASS